MSTDNPDRLAEDYESLYRSYVEARKQIEHLSTLREIGLAINASLDLDEALTTIANVVQGALDVGRLTIFELDEDRQFARPLIAKYGNDVIERARLQEERIPLAGTALGAAMRQRRVLLTNHEQKSIALTPLMAKNHPLGILRLEDRRDGTSFTENDAALFQLLGSQIAIAINNARLYALAVTDGLTKLYVRRYFDLRMGEEFDQAKRYRRCFSLMLFDIDHFKKFNDAHGHQTGDLVLRQFSDLIQNNTRRADVCCRYGGEEIAVIMPETRLNEACVLANKLCARVRQNRFQGTLGQALSVTTSIGVSEYREAQAGHEDMVEEADRALYRAKQLGRNRVELAGL